eukprot:TRINITY_DN100127_c0_g1_i1.p1 TRINITY_DN100127_c0_g1~~TRINITY_DN100127_c0_g1_i1.p1  ORF type:complete len:100 (+),score=20.44 TRINITY_DN100127_c0_g1_i1:42-341(+)
MKTLCQEESIKMPKGVKISIKSTMVEITAKSGILKRNLKHLTIELWLANGGEEAKANMHFATSKHVSMLSSVCSHVSDQFDGVEKKFVLPNRRQHCRRW